jgi:hypothetical protein
MGQNQEKRKYPRVQSDLSLKLRHDDSDIITKAENISISGVYCKSAKPIPLMSKIRILLLLPKNRQDLKPTKKIETTGVVVREHPVIVEGKIMHYDVAIFFDSLSEKEKEQISEHVNKKLQ